MSSPERIVALKGKPTEIGFADLEYMVTARWPENLHWEFKSRGPHPPLDRLESSERAGLGEILSGFANSDGGIAIYGIRSARDGVVDRADQLLPIQEIDRFAELVITSADGLVMPAVKALQFAVVRDPQDLARGFLCIGVPRSDRRPHMSLASGHHRYFFRRSDGFHPMEHYQVEDAFTRHVRATLGMLVLSGDKWKVSRLVDAGDKKYLLSAKRLIGLGAQNESSVSAEYVSVEVVSETGGQGNRIQPVPGYRLSHYDDASAQFSPDGYMVVNPGHSAAACLFHLELSREDPSQDFQWMGPFGKFETDVLLNLKFGAKDTPIQSHKVRIDRAKECELIERVLQGAGVEPLSSKPESWPLG